MNVFHFPKCNWFCTKYVYLYCMFEMDIHTYTMYPILREIYYLKLPCSYIIMWWGVQCTFYSMYLYLIWAVELCTLYGRVVYADAQECKISFMVMDDLVRMVRFRDGWGIAIVRSISHWEEMVWRYSLGQTAVMTWPYPHRVVYLLASLLISKMEGGGVLYYNPFTILFTSPFINKILFKIYT